MTRARRIADRFAAAADHYGQAAHVQRTVAKALAEAVSGTGVTADAMVLELGCGTGFLTAPLASALAPRLWVASDMAPAMLQALGRAVDHPAVRRVALDAQSPCVRPRFDLVCSSLTLQWLANPAAVIARWRALVRPGGLLAFATLLDGSFGEWRAALKAAGAAEPEPLLPDLQTLRAWAPGGEVRALTLVERHASALDFLHSARAAGVDASPRRALDGGVMRRALKILDRDGPAATYNVAIVLVRA